MVVFTMPPPFGYSRALSRRLKIQPYTAVACRDDVPYVVNGRARPDVCPAGDLDLYAVFDRKLLAPLHQYHGDAPAVPRRPYRTALDPVDGVNLTIPLLPAGFRPCVKEVGDNLDPCRVLRAQAGVGSLSADVGNFNGIPVIADSETAVRNLARPPRPESHRF